MLTGYYYYIIILITCITACYMQIVHGYGLYYETDEAYIESGSDSPRTL